MKRIAYILLIVILTIMQLTTYGKEEIAYTNTFDTWVSTDGLGRKLPDNTKAGNVKEDKYVGIFYFLFLDTSYEGKRLNDKSWAYRLGGKEAVWDVLVRDGIDMWGKPYFGYYENQDEWVYQKHAQMLTAAGVDFVFLDITNPNMYTPAWKVLFKVWQQIRDEGGMTPQIMFHCGDDPDRMTSHMNTLWNDIYKSEKYKDLWFMWEDKPLIFGNPQNLKDEYKEFFTIRRSWAFNTWTEDEGGLERWPWIAEYPQVPGKNINGEIEQVSVTAGFHASTSRGRSIVNGKQLSNGKNDFGYSLKETEYGLTFSEQWEHALKVNPKIVTVTGWNEFHNGGSYVKSGEVSWNVADTYTTVYDDLQFGKVFVDCFSAEFSRDIEPIYGYYGDNYYYQLCYYIRLFKGVEKVPKGTGSKQIDINGDEKEWENIGPVFKDITGDTTHRNHRSVTATYTYKNDSGRNDISYAKVSKVKNNTYFYVSCVEEIVKDNGENWMNLFIDTDCNKETGWEGYEYIINRSRDNEFAVIEKFEANSWSFKEVGKAEYVVSGNTMVISVPNNLIGLSERDNFDFKWADNSTTTGNVMEFMDLGDSAPDSRFNFRYVKQGGNNVYPRKVSVNSYVLLTIAISVIGLSVFVFVVLREKKDLSKVAFKKRIKIRVIIFLVLILLTPSIILLGRLIKDKKTITLMVRQDISPDADMTLLKKTIDEYIKSYNKEYKGIKVEVKYVKDFPVNPKEADVLLIPADTALEYMASPDFNGTKYESKFEDLSKYKFNKDEIISSALKMGEIKGTIQWVPFNYDRTVTLCDLNVFEKLNVEVPKTDWTYDDFVRTAESLTQKKDNVSYTGVFLPYHENFVWKQFVRGFGGDWYDQENLELVLTKGNSKIGLDNMFSLLNKGNAKANGFKKNADAYDGMAFSFACQPERNGLYHLSTKQEEHILSYRAKSLASENKILVLPLPTFPEGNVGTNNTEFIHGFAVTKASKKKDIASSFALFSQTVEGQRVLNKYYGGIPTNINAQKEDFWRFGILSGVNADNVLIGIENDLRDDFFEAFSDSQNLYNEALRARVSFSSILFNKFENINKGNEKGLSEEAIKQLKLLEKKVSLVMVLAERD